MPTRIIINCMMCTNTADHQSTVQGNDHYQTICQRT